MSTTSSSSSSEKPIYVRSNNGWNVNVDDAFVAGSGFVRSNLHNNTNIDTDSDGDRVLRAPVDFSTLSIAADFCRNRYNNPNPVAADSAFMATRPNDRDALERLMHAAETLEIQSLLDLTRNRIAELDAAELQNAANLEIDQDVEIITHTLRHTVLAILAISIILIFLILATGGIAYLAIHNRNS